jgi:hypothetical protein
MFVDQTGESLYDTELVKHNLLEETLRVRQNVGFVENLDIKCTINIDNACNQSNNLSV